MSECRHCFRDHDPDAMCWPPVANERAYGDPDEEFGWSGRTDRLESFILDITNPHQDTRRGAPGFVIEEAKAVTARLRDGFASGELTAADLGSTPQAPTPQAGGEGVDTAELRLIADLFDPPHPADAGLLRAAADEIDRLRSTPSVDGGATGIEELRAVKCGPCGHGAAFHLTPTGMCAICDCPS